MTTPRRRVLRVLLVSATLPAPAFALGMGNIGDGLWKLAALLFGALAAWLLAAWAIAFASTRKRGVKQRWRWLLALGIAIAPALPFVAKPAFDNLVDRVRELKMARRAKDADATLARLCTVRAGRAPRVTARPAVARASGLALEIVPHDFDTPGHQTDLDDALDSLQYGTVVGWTGFAALGDPGPATGFDFVELHRWNNLDKPSIVGTRAWWKAKGRPRIAAADWEEIQENTRPDVGWMEADASSPRSEARYVLTLTDLSTRDDRAHWIARGRMKMVDRRDGHVVAEVEELSANRQPGVARSTYGSWDRTRECPGPEQRYADEEGRFDAVRFFFGEVVKAE